MVNERLAGNESCDARAKIEFLQTRRRNWEQIFDYVTRQDVAATLAVIEEANKKVAHTRGTNTTGGNAVLNAYMRICACGKDKAMSLGGGAGGGEGRPWPLNCQHN